MKLKNNIVAVIFILISVILFANGFHRALRISGRISADGLVFEDHEFRKNSSIYFYSGKKNDDTYRISCNEKYDIFFDHVAYNYRPVMVRKDTEEYRLYTNGGYVSGYFTEKYFDSYEELAAKGKLPPDATESNYSQLGIVIVNLDKERHSYLWGVPFLAVGISLLAFKKIKTKSKEKIIMR